MFEKFKNFIGTVSPYVFSRENNNHARSSTAIALDLLTSSINVAAPILFASQAKILYDSSSDEDEYDDEVHVYMGISIGFLLLAQILPKIRNMFINPVRANVQKKLTEAMTNKCYELELDLHLTTRTGEFSQALTKNYSTIDKGLPAVFGEIIPIVLETIGTTIALSVIYGPIGLMQLGILAVYLTVAGLGEMSAKQIREACVTLSYNAYSVVIETINNYQIANQFGNVGYELQRAKNSLTHSEEAYAGVHRKDDVNSLLLSIINGIGFVGALGFIGYEGESGNLRVIDSILFVYFMTRLNVNLDKLPQSLSAFFTAMIDAERITNFLRRQSQVTDKKNAIVLNSVGPLTVEFDKVSFRYPNKLTNAVHDISFTIKEREKIAFVGSTGSGKSTIIKLLLKFYKPMPGSTMTVNGINIEALRSDSLRSHIAVVSQDSVLLNASIKENIRYGDLTANNDEVLAAADLARIFPENEGVPLSKNEALQKLDEIAGQAGGKLSGGEKQRTAIARTLLKEKNLYILDEPTSALDPKTAHQIQNLLDSITANATVIIITHELRTVINADSIHYMDKGEILESGTFEELMSKKGHFYKQFCIECTQQEIDAAQIKRPQRDPLIGNQLSQFWQSRKAKIVERGEGTDDTNESDQLPLLAANKNPRKYNKLPSIN